MTLRSEPTRFHFRIDPQIKCTKLGNGKLLNKNIELLNGLLMGQIAPTRYHALDGSTHE